MRFSARSFSERANSASNAASSLAERPLGRVPLMGRLSTSPSAETRRKRSGELPRIATSPRSMKLAKGAGEARRSAW